jgi:hypothetical protein
VSRKLLFAGLLPALGVVLVASPAAPSAERVPAAVRKHCARGFVAAVIQGKHACLKAGQACKRNLDRQYHR